MIIKMPDEMPNGVFDYVDKRSLIQKFIYYVIDRRDYRKSVYLSNWLKPQVDDASEQMKELALSILADNLTLDYDKIAWKIFRWVKKNVEYIGDDVQWNVSEYWQKAQLTLEMGSGDCEDGAILTYVLCRLAGIPVNRLYLFCGNVLGGGHAWLAYKPLHYPINFVFLDWCFYPDIRSIETRQKFWVVKQGIYGENLNYYNLWWCFNEDKTYLEFKPTGDD